VVALPESTLVVVLAADATGAAAIAAATAPATNSGAKLRSSTVIVLLPNSLGGTAPLHDFHSCAVEARRMGCSDPMPLSYDFQTREELRLRRLPQIKLKCARESAVIQQSRRGFDSASLSGD
jgi:hypothetical protein